MAAILDSEKGSGHPAKSSSKHKERAKIATEKIINRQCKVPVSSERT